MSFRAACLGLIALSSFAASVLAEPVTWNQVIALRAPAPAARIPYGKEPQQFGELRLPEGKGPFPVVVIIHGGCWRAEYDLGYTAPFAAAMAQAGIAAWTIEYRRLGNPGGGWPGTFEDVAHGIDAVKEIAARYPIDPARVVLVGHSAGGQLALCAEASASREKSAVLHGTSLTVRGVVGLAAITDLEAYGREGGSCGESVKELLGGTPAQVRDRYAAANPSALVPLRVPVRLLHGALDPIVPVAQSRGFAEKAVATKDDASLAVVPGSGHFDFFVPATPAFAATLRIVQELLRAR